MDSSVHPHPDSLSRRAAAAAACASRMRINPACVARSPAAAAAASLKPARARSCVGEDTPAPPRAKRLRSGVGEEPPRSSPRAMSLAERDGINDLLMSLVQPESGDSSLSSSERVIHFPDSLVSFLQANQTGRGGGEDEIEIDVYALGDDALHGIKTRIAEYKKTQKEAVSRRQGGLSVREALADVRPAMEAIRRRGIERRRAEARRQVERVVRTVDFNDPYIDWPDVLN